MLLGLVVGTGGSPKWGYKLTGHSNATQTICVLHSFAAITRGSEEAFAFPTGPARLLQESPISRDARGAKEWAPNLQWPWADFGTFVLFHIDLRNTSYLVCLMCEAPSNFQGHQPV